MDSNRCPDSGPATFPGPLPLTMPAELWANLAEEKRTIFHLAQEILDCLTEPSRLGLKETCSRVGRPLQTLLPAFKLLEAIGLIEVSPGPTVNLRALPDEHVRVVGPDGKIRWIFVTRPIRTSAVDLGSLN